MRRLGGSSLWSLKLELPKDYGHFAIHIQLEWSNVFLKYLENRNKKLQQFSNERHMMCVVMSPFIALTAVTKASGAIRQQPSDNGSVQLTRPNYSI